MSILKKQTNKQPKTGPFFAIINIPSERLGTNNNHKEEHPFCLAPWAQRSLPAPQSARSPQGRWAGTRCVPSLRAAPVTLAGGCQDVAPQGTAGGRGQGTGVPGRGRAAGGCSGAGGLLALDGDLAAAAALAVLLVGGDLGRLDDQQPLRGQGGEHRDGIHLVGQPAGKGQERRSGLGWG